MWPPSLPSMLSYIHGPVPMGLVFSSSSVAAAGTILTTERRFFSSASNGYFRVKVTVVASLATTVSMNVRNAP